MTREYYHLLVRVEYQSERGYRMETTPLPDWIHITITETLEDKYLEVHSRIHMNKRARVGPTYSLAFSDFEIIRDLSGEISRRYL